MCQAGQLNAPDNYITDIHNPETDAVEGNSTVSTQLSSPLVSLKKILKPSSGAYDGGVRTDYNNVRSTERGYRSVCTSSSEENKGTCQ